MKTTSFPATKEQLETILQIVADGIIVQDASGKIVYANRAAATLLNFKEAEDLVEAGGEGILSHVELFDEQLRPLSMDMLPGSSAVQGKVEPEHIVGLRFNDTQKLHWVSATATPIFDNKAQVVFAVNNFQEVTSIKNTELRLKDANKRITELLGKTLKTEI